MGGAVLSADAPAAMWIRVFAGQAVRPSLDALRSVAKDWAAARPAAPQLYFEVDWRRPSTAPENDAAWSSFAVRAVGGGAQPLTVIERDDGALLADEVADMASLLSECGPAAGAAWMRERLGAAQAVYAVKMLQPDDGAAHDDADLLAYALARTVSAMVGGGAMQLDGGDALHGDGFFVCVRRDGEASAPIQAGVRAPGGDWRVFTLDLGDPAQKTAFLEGRAPD